MALDISNSDSNVEIIWHTEMDENKSKAGSNESTLKGAGKLESDSKDDEMVPISEKNLKMEDNVANKTLPEDQNIIKEEVVAEEEIDSSLPIKEKKE